MERIVQSWHSPAVNRKMSVARFGFYGRPVVFFPTGGGDFLDGERFLMVKALAPLIDAGRIKLYLVDSVCRWTWASRDAKPAEKSALQAKYDDYLVQELLPWIKADCGGTTQKFAACGASMGGYNALNALAKHPDWFELMVGMSGTYNNDRRMDGHWDENYYYNAPHQFLAKLEEGVQLDALRDSLFVLARGKNWENPDHIDAVAPILRTKKIPHRVEIWGDDSGHDWPTWRTMLPLFLKRLA
jgi:esterase/lipase superfamily enzyme